jgi:hypothetical protein
LNSDTSLVRIILVDEDDIHYLVFEAFPLICDSLDFAFTNHCDETCSLDQIHPNSLIIQVIDAELELKNLNYETDPKQDPESQRYEAKRDKDFEKIEALNQNIPIYGMNWTAGDNGVVEKYYDQKRFMFGEGYNLLGYDYYYDGVFEFLGHQDYPKEEKDFDNIRNELINRGPLKISYHRSKDDQAVVLSGYNFNVKDSTLTFIVKDSQGDTGMNKGFKELKLESGYLNNAFAIIPPIYRNDTVLTDSCHDFDNDGYCFWGIGREKPGNCECQSDIEDCDDSNPCVGGNDENYYCSCIIEMDTATHIISADTTWADSTLVNFNVSIDSGACLTISAYAAFAPGARIVVTQGGKLVIDGGYLTRACNELWEGIEVWGNDTIQYFDEYFGKITVRNGAVIEFAQIAIANYCKRCASMTMQSGGIIEADNAIFRNNEIDVQFSPFTNFWMGNELPYRSTFTKCIFTSTEELYPVSAPITHIDMDGIYDISFSGCVFKNELGVSDIPNSDRGRGITSVDASFMLLQYCNTPNVIPCNDLTPCEFIALEYGIKALNSYSLRTLYIRDVNFENNLVGISLSGIDYASVLTNSFKCPLEIKGVSSDRFKGGLFLENCTGYHVEGNDFHSSSSWESDISPAYGIGVKNSGPANNEIYNNAFNKLETGILCIGENRGERDTSGLCLKCNDMNFNTNDFLVVEDDSSHTGIQGIHLLQGNLDDTISITAPAGNTFTFFDTLEVADYDELEYFNYFNNAENLYYFHHQKELDPVTYPLDSNYTSETIERIERLVSFEKTIACPSGIDSGYLKSYTCPRQNILEADSHISSLKNQLNELIDGGNTEALNFEVMTSLPDEGLELSQELLIDSPYLSDTVIKQAIYKEDVLPNAIIRDIMAANPQSAKKDDLLEALNDRLDPMPGYMMAEIMEGRGYFGAKELLEAEIQSWQQLRAKSKYKLMREFFLDTNIVHPMDSVIAFLETETDLKSKYDLAFACWNKGDSINAWLTLDEIPSQFSLNDDQTIVYQQHVEYFDILQRLVDSNWRACDLDYSSKKDIKEHPANNYLNIFPNPAGDYVIACYNVNSDFLSAAITIYDV